MMKAHGETFSCLLLGYSGFSNTGSEARVITIIDDIRACFGDAVRITVATPAPDKTAKILRKYPDVMVARLPFVFPLEVFRLVSRHDVTFLVEGSTFKQNWGPALLYFFLWGAWCARLLGKKCVAYAVDAGELTPLNRLLTRSVCDKMDLIITRTERARGRLLEMGVKNRVLANTDTAFNFSPGDGAAERAAGGARKTVGIAPIEFHQWPVRVKLFGKKAECFHWPYYYTWSDERREKSRRMVENFRRLVEHCIDAHDLDVVLIGMEELDAEVCGKILGAVGARYRPRVSVVTSKEMTPYEMVPLLRGLDYLVTSRYHACVLSMNLAVPQMAISHDERLQSIYDELGLAGEFLLEHADPLLAERIITTFDRLVAKDAEVARRLRDKHDNYYLPKCGQNLIDLKAWASRSFAPRTPPGLAHSLPRGEGLGNV